jgi:hypothetical protein
VNDVCFQKRLENIFLMMSPSSLWIHWWNVVRSLRPAFSRTSTFLWFATIVAGFAVRTDHLGVTSLVRALQLQPHLYNRLCERFHSSAVKLDRLSALWTTLVLRFFPEPLRINGRMVLVGDGIKIPKCGKKMPGVKLLHQQANTNTKPTYIMGHSLQAVGLLVNAAKSVVAVPLSARIHEGLVYSNRDQRTLLDKMLSLLGVVAMNDPFYFVADAYYAARKIVNGVLDHDNHLITRVKSNAVAYAPYLPSATKKRGRPRLYGEKIPLKTLLADRGVGHLHSAPSPVYGEQHVTIRFRVEDLLWRPAGRLVRFVAVLHPSRGACLLMSTDLSLSAIEIIRLYGLRFKIEHSFKQAVRVIGTYGYHFWMRNMKRIRQGGGDQYLHRESLEYRNAVKRKLHGYHVFIQAGVVCQGLLQYLSAACPQLVWSSFGSWLRTIRSGIPPSELVVINALRQRLPEFLLNCAEQHALAKFIAERQDAKTYEPFRLAS